MSLSELHYRLGMALQAQEKYAEAAEQFALAIATYGQPSPIIPVENNPVIVTQPDE